MILETKSRIFLENKTERDFEIQLTMVAACSGSKASSVNRRRSEDFPTPDSPIMRSFKVVNTSPASPMVAYTLEIVVYEVSKGV